MVVVIFGTRGSGVIFAGRDVDGMMVVAVRVMVVEVQVLVAALILAFDEEGFFITGRVGGFNVGEGNPHGSWARIIHFWPSPTEE